MTALASPFVVDEIGKYILEPASVQPNRERTEYIVVHHANAFYSPGTACASILKAHSARPDFGDYHRIGYHAVLQIERNATIAMHLVNPSLMWGAGVFDRNDVCWHVCAATTFTALPSDEWIEAIARACVYAKSLFPDAKIVGHKDVTVPGHGSECPGQLWSSWKLRLLGRVAALQIALPDPWLNWGAAFPLNPAQREWGIPQCWLKNQWLGQARSAEVYQPDGSRSIQWFVGGWIIYEKNVNWAMAYHASKNVS